MANTGIGHSKIGLASLAASVAFCALAAHMNWETPLKPGLYFAALFFPEGIHGDSPLAFLILWFASNAAMFWAVFYGLLKAIFYQLRKSP